MSTAGRLKIFLTASMFLAGPAMAAEMTGAAIEALLSGITVYLETTPSSVTGAAGQGVIYYAADGSGLYKTPTGAVWHGAWSVKGDLYCSDWKEGPKRPCMKLDKQGDTISYIDSETGKVRAKVLKTAPGNAEKLMP